MQSRLVDFGLELEAKAWGVRVCTLLQVTSYMFIKTVANALCSFIGISALLKGFFLRSCHCRRCSSFFLFARYVP